MAEAPPNGLNGSSRGRRIIARTGEVPMDADAIYEFLDVAGSGGRVVQRSVLGSPPLR
jgi:hypothetical protein